MEGQPRSDDTSGSTVVVNCRHADLSSEADGKLLLEILNVYACDPMGGGEPLSEYVTANLISELRSRPSAHVFFGYVDGNPAGLSVCFEGFSTFHCKPLLNIHDMVVMPQFRRRGVCSSLLAAIEDFSVSRGYCKITMEVLEGNDVAKATYTKAGFGPYYLDPNAGCAQFWEKKIHHDV